MSYGTSVTKTRTRLPDPAITFQLLLVTNLNDSVGGMTATFSRADSGTYLDSTSGLITIAIANIARFEANGILVEEARTNICLQTEDFSSVSWTESADALAIVGNEAVAPDGISTADLLIDDSGGGTGTVFVFQSITTATSTAHTYSMFLKEDQLNWARLQISGMASQDLLAYFDLINGVVGATVGSDNTSEFIESVGNGWYRSRFTFTTDSVDTLANYRVFVADDNGDVTVDLDGTSSIFVWGSNLEAGEFATSYIPATTVSVLRSADFLSYNDDTVLLDSEGSLFAEITPLFSSTISNDAVIVNIADQLIGPLYITDDTTQKVAIGDGTNVATYDPTFIAGQTYKVAACWSAAANEMQIVVNGVAGTVQPYDGAFARTAGTMYIGADSTGNHFNGNIKNVIGYNNDLGETQLKIITG